MSVPVSVQPDSPLAAEARYLVCELAPEEWHLLLALPPFSDMGKVTLAPGSDRVLAVRRRNPDGTPGEALGYWFGWWAFHVEPLFLAPEVRGNAGVIRRLWAGVRRMLAALGVDTAFAIIHPSNAATRYAQQLGFSPAPGMAWIYQAPPSAERVALLEQLREAERARGGAA